MSSPFPIVHSAETTSIYVNPQIVDYILIGQPFTVNITVANVTDLAYWQVRLGFNPTVLNCTDATIPQDNIFEGYLQEPVIWSINNAEGFIRVENKLGQAGGVSGSGTLFQVEFKGLVEGSSYLNFQYIGTPIGTVLIDSSSNSIPFDTEAGLVKVNIAQVDIPNVPFYFQEKKYYSGPAALKMMLDLYGENIPQLEIAEVARTHPNVTYTDELRRAAHFSNISTSMGQEMLENITGYSLRQLGYGAFEKSSLTLTQLQASLRMGYPVIVSTWYDLSKQNSHYRLVIGYNATHIKLYDPWNKATWGGTYGGANTHIEYSTFATLWNQSNNWGLFVHPWKVTITIKMLNLDPYKFNVTASIQYTNTEIFTDMAYAASEAKATIALPAELSLEVGESATKVLNSGSLSPGNSTNVHWIVNGNQSEKYNITIIASGKIAGSVDGHGSYPEYSYEDVVSANNSVTVWLGGTPSSLYPGDIDGDGKVDIKDIATAAKAYGSRPGDLNWNPIADVTGDIGEPDGKVDILDLAFIAIHYGDTY
jgi:hypothetical protein